MGRVLGIDIGMRTTGLAVSDELGLCVRALPNRKPGSRAQDIGHVLQLCQQMQVQTVVVGYPLLPQSAQEGFMARRTRRFAEALQQTASEVHVPLHVHLVDESYTSATAYRQLAGCGLSAKRRRHALDAASACLLVEDFLATQKH
ncbi:MAG: Holliday junction resolvase RuvX [Myxococcota bacterium]